jgi:alpha,alpha-trehalase
MLDFDGTIAPIRKLPEAAWLPLKMKRTLKKLALNPQISLAVISGRGLNDVRQRVGIKKAIYAGCHGMEFVGPNWGYEHPRAPRFREIVKQTARKLTEELKNIKGILVEDKELAVAVHYRMADEKSLKIAKEAVERQAMKFKRGLTCCAGRKVLELRPKVSWDKGSAVELLLKRHRAQNPFPIYIGDDLTDESAFRAISGRGLGILIKNRERPANSAAVFSMDSLDQVQLFLESLCLKV